MRGFYLQFLGAIAFCTSRTLARIYTISNNCPLPIPWYIGSDSQGSLAAGALAARELDQNFSGLIFTDVNGGNSNGNGTTRAGFYGSGNYYYTVVNMDIRFNTGISIEPQAPINGDFCKSYTCEKNGICDSAYQSPPTSFPSANGTAPQPPLYECPGNNVGYKITFCPSGSFPPTVPTTIHPNGNKDKCLDVSGGVYQDGTPVQIYDCNGSNAQLWTISAAGTIVQAGQSAFCLDAGTTPASGVGMKIWQCYNNLPAQSWYYTADKRIAVTGQGQCLDVPNGSLNNGNQVQTWTCTDGDTNQVWNLGTEL